MGFDVDQNEERIAFTVERSGEEIHLAHVFRTPNAEELIAHRRELSSVKGGGRKVLFVDNTVPAQLKLWSKIVLRVEGYTAGENDLMDDGGWRDRVPPLHKTIAVTLLTEYYKAEEEEEAKNSPTLSGDISPRES